MIFLMGYPCYGIHERNSLVIVLEVKDPVDFSAGIVDLPVIQMIEKCLRRRLGKWRIASMTGVAMSGCKI